MNIGFIGIGLMGNPMARNIVTHNGSLAIWNRTPKRAEPLVNL